MKKLIVLVLIVHFQLLIFNCFGQEQKNLTLSDLDKGNASNVLWGIYNDVASSSTENLYAVSIPSMNDYIPGMIINFKAGFTNSDSAYLKVNDLDAVPIVKQDTLLLDSNDIIKGKMVSVIYDGLYFNLIKNKQTLENHGWWIDSLVGTRTFIVPVGINCINVIMVGSGGGGSLFYYKSQEYGCQGGSGTFFKGRIKVSPGEKITIVIGSPGSNSANAAASYFKDGKNNNIITVMGGCGTTGTYSAFGPFCWCADQSYNAATIINNTSRIIGDYSMAPNIIIRDITYGTGEDLQFQIPNEERQGCCLIEW